MLIRLSSAGAVVDTLAIVPGTEQFVSFGAGSRAARIEDLPFGRRTVTALHDDLLYLGTGEDAGVRTIDRAGRVRLLLEVPSEPVEVGAADIEQYWQNLVTFGGRGEDRERPSGIRYPRTLPAHGPLHVDATGRIWVAEPRLPRQWDQPASWWVHAPTGELLATIRLPPRSLVLQIGEDWILLRELDAAQREIVSVYRFSPAH